MGSASEGRSLTGARDIVGMGGLQGRMSIAAFGTMGHDAKLSVLDPGASDRG